MTGDMELTAALDFLRTRLPAEDLASCPPDLLAGFARHALTLRRLAPWCAALEEEIFLHYVLFPRVNDEDLSGHRRLFFDALWPRVRGLSRVEDVVLEVNRWCHERASYALTDDRTASPLTVYRCGSGRCGEESAFLTAALRSVGVPARQVYVPRWSHCDDNHAWVEALCGDRWRFLGACEPEPVLDRGWFNTAASRAVLVRSRLFGEGSSSLHGRPIGREGAVTFYNQTARYAPVTERVFRAVTGGAPAAGAAFRLQILNEASFHTVAVLTGDANGEARAALGPGTVHVLASLGALAAEGDSEGGELTLTLAPPKDVDTGWRPFDFHAAPPAPVNPAPLTAAERARRAAWRQSGDGLRARRLAALSVSDPAHPEWDGLLRAAGGNAGELLAFLRGENAPDRERLLRTLAPKDLRDTDRDTLESHFSRLPPRPEGLPPEIYWKALACPRIGREKLLPWRGGQYGALGPRERLVAGLRREGIPARLRPLDGAPEVWEDGGFRPVTPEETGTLRLALSGGTYRQSWTLSRRREDGWELLDLSACPRREEALTAALPAGDYRLITSVRLPGGDQLALCRDFPLPAGGERSFALRFREYAPEDALFSQAMPPLPALDLSGRPVPDIFRLSGGPALLVWAEEGAEPTEHLLSELAAGREAFRALSLELVLLLRSREALERKTVRELLRGWEDAHVLLDDWSFDLETAARELSRDPDAPPLCVLCDGSGRAVYADSGYRAGASALLLRAAGCLAQRPR